MNQKSKIIAGPSKISEAVPNILRLKRDGTIYCADGRDAKKYLAEYARFLMKKKRERGTPAKLPETPFCLIDRETVVSLEAEAFMARHWPA